nr:hypothetical protein HUO10_004369 [Paraburkholderia busanensis]
MFKGVAIMAIVTSMASGQKNSPSIDGRAAKRRCYSGQPARATRLGADGSIVMRQYLTVEVGVTPIYQNNVAASWLSSWV